MLSSFQPQQVAAVACATASAVEAAYTAIAGHGAKQRDAETEAHEELHQHLAASREAAVAAVRAQSLGNQLAERVAVARTDLDDALLPSSSSGGASSSSSSSSSSGGAAYSSFREDLDKTYRGVQLISQRASTFLQQVKASGLELLRATSLDEADEEGVGDGAPKMYSLQEAASASVRLSHNLWKLWREKHAALSASENLYMALLADSRRTSALVAELTAVQAMLQPETRGLSEVASSNCSTTSVAGMKCERADASGDGSLSVGDPPVFTGEANDSEASSVLQPSERGRFLPSQVASEENSTFVTGAKPCLPQRNRAASHDGQAVPESSKIVPECSQNAQEVNCVFPSSHQDAFQNTQAAPEMDHMQSAVESRLTVPTDHQHTSDSSQGDEKQVSFQHGYNAGGGSRDVSDHSQDVVRSIQDATEVDQDAHNSSQVVLDGLQGMPAVEKTEGMHEHGCPSPTKEEEDALIATRHQPEAAKPQNLTDDVAGVPTAAPPSRVLVCSAYTEPQASRSRSARASRAAAANHAAGSSGNPGSKLDGCGAGCSGRGASADVTSARQDALQSVTATIEAQATEAVDSFRERAKHYPCGWPSPVTGFLQISRSDEQFRGVLEAFEDRVAQERSELLTQVLELALAPNLRTLTASLSRRVAFWEAEIEENWTQWSKQSGHFHEACVAAAECWTQLREMTHNLLAWTQEFVHAAPLGDATPPMLHMVPLLDSEGARHYRRWQELHDAHVEIATVLSLLGGWAEFHNLRGDGHVLTEARDLLHAVITCLDVQFAPFRFEGRHAVCTKLSGNQHWRLVAGFEAAGPDREQPPAWPWWSPRGWPGRPGLSPVAFAALGLGNGSVHVI